MNGTYRQLTHLRSLRGFIADVAPTHDTRKCPCCRHGRLSFDEQSFLCGNPDCTLRVGTIIEWLSAFSNVEPEAAVETLLNRYGEDSVTLAGPRDLFIKAIHESREVEQKLARWFVAQQQQHHWQSNPYRQQAATVLRGWGLDPEDWHDAVWIASKKDMIELAALAKLAGFKFPTLPDQKAFILFPYWKNLGELGHLAFIDIRSRQVLRAERSSAKLSWFGMWSAATRGHAWLCADDPVSAIKWTTDSKALAMPRYCLSVWYDSEAPGYGHLPDALTWVLDKRMSCKLLSRVAAAIPRVEVTEASGHQPHLQTQPFHEMLDVLFLRAVAVAHDAPDILREFLQTTSIPRETLDRWARMPAVLHSPKAAAEVAKRQAYRVVHASSRGEILEMADGYFAMKAGMDQPTMVANFTLLLEETVVFRQLNTLRVCHAGVLRFGRRDYKIMVSSDDLQDPRKIELAARFAESQDDQRRRDDLMPVITDRTMFKHVLETLRVSSSQLPKMKGITHFGWDENGLSYYTPYGNVNTAGVCEYVAPRLELTNAFLRNFSPLVIRERFSGLPSELPEVLVNLVARLVAISLRYRMGRPLYPLAIRNEPASRLVMERMFQQLGQTRIVRLSFNDRTFQERYPAYGFPFVADGYTEAQSLRSKMTAVLLLERGEILPEVDEATAIRCGMLLRDGLLGAARLSLRDELEELRTDSDVGIETQMLQEGLRILAVVFQDLRLDTSRRHELT